ncbi:MULTISPECIES: outer membrane protein assembly factor BamA [unclassified Sphingomonas]|uniref:outer membrane protein assembly factor BamA n=1 Tax=unclassified Sphingomonas TaxID=196159 RepID=UPI0006FD5A30|nr:MULTISPECIES: outer membrane protein assembly factor BamA [unclassified Sphingomonas]KQN04163.1 outer membrane protein assembly factor BamA [Sphingomonas sp. Leaf25]KQN37153.1 outer membrane protein assembly factor BamA [Sphingomonas sp. Leaf42]KQT30801.1 outer membrane protein assembly factor BamA [Sphingomonas sp. Leaf407]
MSASKFSIHGAGGIALLAGTMLSSTAAFAQARQPVPAPPVAAPAPAAPAVAPAPVRTIRSLRVEGSQRIEPDTVLSYTKLRVGAAYTAETLDQAIKDLYASDLLADVAIEGAETGDVIVRVRENPIINRVVLEGNKRLKDDKITKEIKLAPRQIFTRTAVRADVARIVELYRRQGRFAANVQPKMVMLDQNRVDVIFEISEGAKSKVRQINILGNEVFGDSALRSEMATKESRPWRIFSSNTSYDQDRLAYDQQKLRQFYLTNGYADFRVISAVAELTPDKEDFIITYVVEEGQRYKFGDVSVESAIRDFDNATLTKTLPMKKGDWYNAKQVEDTVDQLSEYAGLFGYAFTDVRPEFKPDRENHVMGIEFFLAEANRTYVEKIDITGNTQTQDRVIRREFRVAEGDAFNAFLIKRSQDRINSLGYFQDKFEIERKEGSAPDRIVLAANVEEKSTGELTLSAGFSSLERFIIQASIRQRNFRGKGQDLQASVNYSTYQKSVELGFTEPYLFDKNIALGGTLFRRDFNSFNYLGSDRNTTYTNTSTGGQIVASVPLTEFWTLSGRYQLSQDNVGLDENTFYTNGECDPTKAGRYLCEAIGNRLTSMVGLNLIFDNLNNRIRPSRGQRLVTGLDFAGLGGDVRYARVRGDFDKYWNVGGFILSAGVEGGYIHALQKSSGEGIDAVRIVDRFYLGEPQFRGFDIRGVGPRVQRLQYTGSVAGGDQTLVTDRQQVIDDPLGGKGYYLGKIELEPPLGSGIAELGLRPSIFIQAGALFGVTRPLPTIAFQQATNADGSLRTNADGSPSLLPSTTLSKTTDGLQIYNNQFTDATGSTAFRQTTCVTGFSSTVGGTCVGGETNTIATSTTTPFLERFLGDSARPRLSVGIGVNWNSPFGPLRIDVAKALLSQPGDDKKLITFNVGTQF